MFSSNKGLLSLKRQWSHHYLKSILLSQTLDKGHLSSVFITVLSVRLISSNDGGISSVNLEPIKQKKLWNPLTAAEWNVVPDGENQLDFFSQEWQAAQVETITQGGCMEARPFPPTATCLDRLVSELPLLPSTRYSLINDFGISRLTATQWRFVGPILGQRDLLLISRPREGKSLITLVALIELLTQRALGCKIAMDQLESRRTISHSEESFHKLSIEPIYKNFTSNKQEKGSDYKSTLSHSAKHNVEEPFHPDSDVKDHLMAIVISPTRDASYRLSHDCSCLLRYHPLNFRVGEVWGGVDIDREISKLSSSDRPHVLFATLGRLTDHLWNTKSFSAKLRKVEFLVIDDAFNLLQQEMHVDQIRAIRNRLSVRHQTILLAPTMDQSLRRLAFRTLKTNFAMINCVENFEENHRFNFNEWTNVSVIDDNEDSYTSSAARKRNITETKEKNNNSMNNLDSEYHPPSTDCILHNEKKTQAEMIHPFLCRIKGNTPNLALLAGELTESFRRKRQSEMMGALTSSDCSTMTPKRPEANLKDELRQISLPDLECALKESYSRGNRISSYFEKGRNDQSHDNDLASSMTTVSNSENRNSKNTAISANTSPNGDYHDVWITRTSEVALRSSACPTSPSVPIYSLIYPPNNFVTTLYNLIQLEVNGTMERFLVQAKENLVFNLEDVHQHRSSRKLHDNSQYSSEKLLNEDERKIVVIFPTIRAVEFYSMLFRDYLQVHCSSTTVSISQHSTTSTSCREKGRTLSAHDFDSSPLESNITENDSPVFISFCSQQSSEKRRSSLRRFARSRSAIMFCSSLIHCASISAHTVIQVGISNIPEDAVKHSGIATSYSGHMILLMNPLELKYLEDLILLRIPIIKLNAFITQQLQYNQMPKHVLSNIAPSKRKDYQKAASEERSITKSSECPSNAPVRAKKPFHDDFSFPLVNKSTTNQVSFSNPSSFPVPMLEIGSILPRVTSFKLYPWYYDPKMLAACQLMYRSLLGYYCMRHKELKIVKDVIPEVLNDHLLSAGLHQPPPISLEFAARMKLQQAPEQSLLPDVVGNEYLTTNAPPVKICRKCGKDITSSTKTKTLDEDNDDNDDDDDDDDDDENDDDEMDDNDNKSISSNDAPSSIDAKIENDSSRSQLGESTSTTNSLDSAGSGEPKDAGSGEPKDAGSEEPKDAGSGEPKDAASGEPKDAGSEPKDAGSEEPKDAGSEPKDAGSEEPKDAGSGEPKDAGSEEPKDAGSEPKDAGSEEPKDAGSGEPKDAGSSMQSDDARMNNPNSSETSQDIKKDETADQDYISSSQTTKNGINMQTPSSLNNQVAIENPNRLEMKPHDPITDVETVDALTAQPPLHDFMHLSNDSPTLLSKGDSELDFPKQQSSVFSKNELSTNRSSITNEKNCHTLLVHDYGFTHSDSSLVRVAALDLVESLGEVSSREELSPQLEKTLLESAYGLKDWAKNGITFRMMDRFRRCILDEPTGRTILERVIEFGLSRVLQNPFFDSFFTIQSLDRTDNFGNSILHLAALSESPEVTVHTIRKIIANLRTPQERAAFFQLKNKNGETALHLAEKLSLSTNYILKSSYGVLTRYNKLFSEKKG